MPLAEQHVEADLDLWLHQFELDQPHYARLIRGFARREPERFLDYGVKAFVEREFSPSLRCVGVTLVQNPELPKRVLALFGQSRAEAIELVQKLIQCDSFFDLKILEAVRPTGGESEVDKSIVARAIDVLDATSIGMRLVPSVKQLLSDPDPRIQSKAAAFVGRRMQNVDWVKRQMVDDDPRVRANVVEILSGIQAEPTVQLMRNATRDRNNRVRGNALLGLYRLGDASILPEIFQMAQRPEALFRTTAAWVMGATGDPRFAKALASLMQDPEKTVRKNALNALQRIKANVHAIVSQGELRISAVALKQQNNYSNLTMVVQDSGGNVLQQIPPTSWVLADGDNVIRDYSVQRIERQKPLSVSFLTADAAEVDGLEFGAAIQAVRRCLAIRRLEDRWTVLKLEAIQTGASDLVDSEIDKDTTPDLTQVQKVPGARDIPLTFTRVFPEIESMLSGDALRVGRSAAEAVGRASLEVLAAHRLPGEKQHLICLGAAGLDGLPDRVAFEQTGSRVSVHVIALPVLKREAEVKAFVESTGGYFAVAPDAAAIPEMCKTLYTALYHCYELSWEGTPSQLTVKLYGEHGYAVTTVESPRA